MATFASEVGDEAYRLYCRSRYGDLQSFLEFEHKCSETANPRDRLLWQGYLGNALFYSQHNRQNADKAKELCKSIFPALKATVEEEEDTAEACPHLQYLLAWCYHNSLGVTQNHEEAVRLFRLASNKGLAIAQSNLGICYDDGEGVPQDRTEGARLYRLGANRGHAPAQYNLGLSFYYGYGLSQDVIEAAKLFRLAADQGFSPGQCMLGECYDKGLGVQHDITEAIHWYTLAATQGHADAQLTLGQCYQYGDGVPKDEFEAARLMHLAADQGLDYAQYYYANFLGDSEEAVKWYRLAAAQDFSNALVALGRCFAQGLGVGVDVIEAVKWYTKAAEKNHSSASEALVAINDAYVEAIWNNRKSFLLFLAQYQFIYRPPSPAPTPSSEQQQAPLAAPINTLSLVNHTIEADPDVVYTVFHTEDMRREIMSFL